MKISFKSHNPYNVFWVIKAGYIWSFILIWNMLCGTGIYLNGGLGKVEKPGALVMMSLACLFAACCAFAPLKSETVRNRWCKEQADFEDARYGLWQMGVVAGLMFIVSLFSLIEHIR